MATTQYGKYILRATAEKNSFPENSVVRPISLEGLKDWGGIQHRMHWTFVSQPVQMVEGPHSHDFDEFLCFFGCEAANGPDFGAEVEVSLGQEGEKQIITAPSIVCIPKGLIHCPINFKKVDKPVMFCQTYTAPEYVSKPV